MHPLLTRIFPAFMLCWLLPAVAQAESLILTYDRSTQLMALTSGATPSSSAQKAEQVVTLYPRAYSSRTGPIENIYDFDKKTFTVVNHAARNYMLYPLHTVAISRKRERTNRLGLKIAMYQQSEMREQIPIGVLTEDMDIDMMMSGNKNNKTANKIMTQEKDGQTIYSDTKNTLARVKASQTNIPAALKATYAHFVIYELTVHPFIKNALGSASTAFDSIDYKNRDIFRNLSAQYTWKLKGSTQGGGDTASIPADYARIYHIDPAINKGFIDALVPYTFDKPGFDAKIAGLIEQRRYLEAYLATQAEILIQSKTEAAKNAPAFQSGKRAAQIFERAVYLSVTQSPTNATELKQYKEILEKAKKRAGEYSWLLDYYIAQHTRSVIGKKQTPNKFDLEQITQANKVILDTLQHLPRLVDVYQQAGDAHISVLEVPKAMIYWSHVATFMPDSDTARSLSKLLGETEEDFPEYF